MTIALSGSFEADEKTRRYATKVIGSLEKYLGKQERERASAAVVLNRVNRSHGNKYEAEVTLKIGDVTLMAKDSTLNVLAALDIVRRKLAIELKNRV